MLLVKLWLFCETRSFALLLLVLLIKEPELDGNSVDDDDDGGGVGTADEVAVESVPREEGVLVGGAKKEFELIGFNGVWR